MQTLDEFFCVYDTLWLDLVDICFQHGLEGGAESLLRELKGSQNFLHFCDSDPTTSICIGLFQCVVELELLHVHFSDINLV